MFLFTDSHCTTLSPSSSCLRSHCIRVTLARMPYVDGRTDGRTARGAGQSAPAAATAAGPAAQVGEAACMRD